MFSSCGLSLTPSFARRVAFSELLRQLFSLRLRLQPEIAIPDWAVSQCDGGHGAAAGCAQLLRPSVAERLHVGRSVAELPPSKLSNFGHSVNSWTVFSMSVASADGPRPHKNGQPAS